MTRAVKDCTYVIHVASPLPSGNPRDDMELIGPAVDGTKSVLEACAKTKGGVKRVVLTSSCAAIIGKRTGAIDPRRATSFPGFSPTRPMERERAGRREPWERGSREGTPYNGLYREGVGVGVGVSLVVVREICHFGM